jgi:glycosyltransferase involved in cell wall biosynthesis
MHPWQVARGLNDFTPKLPRAQPQILPRFARGDRGGLSDYTSMMMQASKKHPQKEEIQEFTDRARAGEMTPPTPPCQGGEKSGLGEKESGVHAPPNAPKRKLKVCLASLAPFIGGAEIAAERSALGLLRAGHDVFMLLGREGAVGERFEKAGLRCVYTPMRFTDRWRFWHYFQDRSRIFSVLRSERPDILHANDLPTHQAVAGAAHGLPIARLCHHRQVFNGKAIAWFDKFGAHHHVFVSRALMEELCAASPPLAAKSRAVLYDGLELPAPPTPDDRKAARRRLHLSIDRCQVLFAGQIIVRKGVADLLEAWAKLPMLMQEKADLLIVGEDLENHGAYRTEMERLANNLGVNARFCGFQKNIGDWLMAVDLAVVPSHVEPLGNATLEAMSYALPVIGGKVGGIPEMIRDQETGLLVPAKDPAQLAEALRVLLTDVNLRARLGAAGRVRCEKEFSLMAHTEALVREYSRTLAIASESQARCQPC